MPFEFQKSNLNIPMPPVKPPRPDDPKMKDETTIPANVREAKMNVIALPNGRIREVWDARPQDLNFVTSNRHGNSWYGKLNQRIAELVIDESIIVRPISGANVRTAKYYIRRLIGDRNFHSVRKYSIREILARKGIQICITRLADRIFAPCVNCGQELEITNNPNRPNPIIQ